MTAPWEPDRALTTEGATAAINSRFPDIDTRQLSFLGSGWEFDVWMNEDGWVFRFPRRAESSGLFEQERRIHDLVSRFLSPGIGIPHAELFGEPAAGFPYPIVAHRFIPGTPADVSDERLWPVLAREIGQALGAIHSIPVGSARAAGVEEIEGDDKGRNQWIEHPLEVLTALRGRDPRIDHAVEWTRQVSVTTMRSDGPLRFIHHDLSPEHLLVDPESGRLTGILDWTDAIIGDAARDFVFLVAWRGWQCAEEVLSYYPHQVDPGFRERLRFMSKVLTVAWLGYAHTRGTEVDKLTSWVHNAFAPELHTIPKRQQP